MRSGHLPTFPPTDGKNRFILATPRGLVGRTSHRVAHARNCSWMAYLYTSLKRRSLSQRHSPTRRSHDTRNQAPQQSGFQARQEASARWPQSIRCRRVTPPGCAVLRVLSCKLDTEGVPARQDDSETEGCTHQSYYMLQRLLALLGVLVHAELHTRAPRMHQHLCNNAGEVHSITP